MALNWRKCTFLYWLGFFIGIVTLFTIPEQSKVAKVSRLPLTLIGFISGCLLLYDGKLPAIKEVELTEKEQELAAREAELSAKEQQLYQDRETLQIQHQNEVAQVEARLQKWVDEQVQSWQLQYQQQADMYEGIISSLKQQLLLANAPRRPKGIRTIDDHCNKIQDFLLQKGIIVHCDIEPSNTLSEEIFIFTLHNPEDVSRIRDLTEQLECLLNLNGSISVKRDGSYLKITHYLRELSPEKKL